MFTNNSTRISPSFLSVDNRIQMATDAITKFFIEPLSGLREDYEAALTAFRKWYGLNGYKSSRDGWRTDSWNIPEVNDLVAEVNDLCDAFKEYAAERRAEAKAARPRFTERVVDEDGVITEVQHEWYETVKYLFGKAQDKLDVLPIGGYVKSRPILMRALALYQEFAGDGSFYERIATMPEAKSFWRSTERTRQYIAKDYTQAFKEIRQAVESSIDAFVKAIVEPPQFREDVIEPAQIIITEKQATTHDGFLAVRDLDLDTNPGALYHNLSPEQRGELDALALS